MDAGFVFSNYGLALVAVVLLSLCFHEYCHALVADRLGDDVPRREGRLSINPLKHLSFVGTLVFILTQGFGWARPVPVNFVRLGLRGTALVAIAGPLSNVLLACASALLLGIMKALSLDGKAAAIAAFTLSLSTYVNVLLALANILPIPPLDGFRVLLFLASKRKNLKIQKYGLHNMRAYMMLDLAGAASVGILHLSGVLSDYFSLGKHIFEFLVALSFSIFS